MGSGMPVTGHTNYMQNQNSLVGGLLLDNTTMTTSGSSVTSSSSSAMSISSTASNVSSVASSSFGNLTQNCNTSTMSSSNNSSIMGSRNNDWQTIQPPSRQQQQQQQLAKTALGTDWSSLVVKPNNVTNNTVANVAGMVVGGGTSMADQLCDNLNGITLNDLASSQNSLGINIVGNTIVDSLANVAEGNSSSLVNGVAAAAASATAASVSSVATTPNIFGPQTNPIINIINNNNSCNGPLNGIDDHDTSFSKNGTEILDFDPNTNTLNNCDSCSNSSSGNMGQMQVSFEKIIKKKLN